MGTPEGRRHLGTAVFFALATTALPGQVTAGEDLKASVCAGECGALARDALGDECGPGSMDTSGLDKGSAKALSAMVKRGTVIDKPAVHKKTSFKNFLRFMEASSGM